MARRERPKGYIGIQLTAFCGNCDAFQYVDDKKKRHAGTQLRQWAWRLTRKDGWLCDQCAEKLDQQEHRDG